MDRLRSLRVGGLQVKLIAPYLILTLIIASAGIFLVTLLTMETEEERFANSLMDASRNINDSIVQQERNQLERLRMMIFADGMAQAMYDRDTGLIEAIVKPLVLTEETQKIDLAVVVDSEGQEIVTLGKDPNSERYYIQQGVSFAGLSSVRKVLENEVDDQGDKFVELAIFEQGTVLFTSAPVRDANDQLVGAILVGSYLDNAMTRIKNQSIVDVVVVDLQGKKLAATLVSEVGLDKALEMVKDLDPNALTQPVPITLNNRPYRIAYSPLKIRDVQVGWTGVTRSTEYLFSTAARSRQIFIILFSVGTIAIILIGYLLAQDIARPLLKLRSMSQAVAAGDLKQNISLRRKDEIGDLGEAFDTMTLHLQERTEEAQRLYEETLQRNKELAEINARLEATQLQLIQSEKLASIGQLTAGIVHDVKNPFAVIMGMAEVLADDETMDAETKHGLKVIRESAIKGNTIVSDLLKFARQSHPEMRTMDIRETVQTAMRLTAYLTRRFNTVTDLPEAPLIVTYDAQLVEQVLINMIHNAVQAMPNGGSLRISVKCIGETAQIAIQDSGSGISPENLKRIFDPFFTTKPEGEGTGLGLSVSYGIIANHNGRIDVESEMGKGTTFTIVLPIEQQISRQGEISE